jgi:hypothetical protein
MTAAPVSPPTRVRTAEAARITGLAPRTLQEKAAAGLIPGARKVFGRWTYDMNILMKLGREQCRKTSRKASTGAGTFSGRVSRSEASSTARAYELVLSQWRKGAPAGLRRE